MTSVKNFRRALLISSASLAIFACSDTNISSPGTTTPPVGEPTGPTTPTPPTGTSIPASATGAGTADVSHPNLTRVTVATADGGTTDIVQISGTVATDLTLETGVVYYLNETLSIGADSGAASTTATADGKEVVLTIPAGTTVVGDGSAASLIIPRGGKIMAEGTASSPIVFTSYAEFQRQNGITNVGTETTRGEWGGIMINGFAPINVCDTTGDNVADGGCTKEGEANSGVYGGDNAADNSGVLTYVRVEHGGVVLNDSNEANGIAFQGVGSGTTVNHIHIHNNLDDGVEFFGGTVSVDHLVVTGQSDDAIDWTDGWTGSVQYALVTPGTNLRDDAYGIEGDNQRPNDLLPRSAPVISNATILGNDEWVAGVRFRRGSAVKFVNSIVAGTAPFGMDIDDAATYDLIIDGTSKIESVMVDATGDALRNDDDIPADFALTNYPNVVVDTSSLLNKYFPGGQEQAVTAFDVTGEGLEAVDYIGAFSPTETVASNWAAGWTKEGTVFEEEAATCPTGTTTSSSDPVDGKTVCDIPLNITSDVRLSNGDDLIYRLTGATFIGTDGGKEAANVPSSVQATLSVDAGVTVFAQSGAEAYLVASRGSKLEAVGTAAAPVVFTAEEVLTNNIKSGETLQHTRGYWGGIMLNGKAPVNVCDTTGDTVADGGCEKTGEFASGSYGGEVSNDDSGALRYVRVEYAGVIVNDDNEANGIAAQGVGSGTEIEYVQIHNNLDDGIEFFGGTVDAKHIVVTGQSDDAIDWTDGWVGRVQYAIVEPGETLRDDAYGIEGDNQRPNDLLPRSAPQLSNLTIIGNSEWVAGARIRRGSGATVANTVITGAPFGWDIDDASTYELFDGTTPVSDFSSMLLDNTGDELRDDGDIPATFIADHFDADNNIDTISTTTLGGFSFFGNATGVVPSTAEAAVTAKDMSTVDAWFEATDYIGAVKDADDKWYLGWTIDSSRNVTSAN
ncbi:hypothetical protein [Hirschia litorea]|uniref:Lipoprotein n=1 Tax=Hirschia litorea TaxID=1199156 RepID=A0ABW2IGW3_9PROT